MEYKGRNYRTLTDTNLIDIIDESNFDGNDRPWSIIMDLVATSLGSGGGGEPLFNAWIAGPPNISEFTNDEGYAAVESVTFLTPAQHDRLALSASAIVSVEARVTLADETNDTVFTTSSQWTPQDLRYTINRFVVDTANTSGHFLDVSSNRVTLGSGNTNEYVVSGVAVTLSGSPSILFIAVSNDGSGDNDVVFTDWEGGTVTLPTGTYSVTSIYGAYVNNGSLYGDYNNGKATLAMSGPSASKDYALNNTGADVENDTIRQVIPASEIANDGSLVRVSFKSVTGAYTIKHASIVERASGEAPNSWYMDRADPAKPTKSVDSDVGSFALQFNGTGGTGIPSDYDSEIAQTSALTASATGYTLNIRAKGDGLQGIAMLEYNDGTDDYIFDFTLGAYKVRDGDHTNCYQTFTGGAAYSNNAINLPAAIYSTHDVTVRLRSNASGLLIDQVSFINNDTSADTITNGGFETWVNYNGYDGMVTPVKLTFNGGEDDVVVASTTTVESDWLTFDINETKDYLVILDLEAGSTMNLQTLSIPGGDETTYRLADTTSYDERDLHSPPTATTANQVAFVSKFEVATTSTPVCDLPYVILGNTEQAVAPAFDIDTFEVFDLASDDDNAGYLMSFDSGLSWKMWVDAMPPLWPTARWVPVASSKASDHGGTEGQWYYLDLTAYPASISWVALTGVENNAHTAISEFSEHLPPDADGLIMDKSTVENGVNVYDTNGYNADGKLRYAIIYRAENSDDFASTSEIIYENSFAVNMIVSPILPGGASEGIVVASYDVGPGTRDWIVLNEYSTPLDALIVKYLA